MYTEQLGIHPEVLRTSVKRAEIDAEDRPGTTSSDAERLAQLDGPWRGLDDIEIATVEYVLAQFDLTIALEEPPVRGSWRQRFYARSREIAGSEPMRQRLAELGEAIQLEHLGKRRPHPCTS
ncbi:hypothetical protein ALI144C_37355 [Actinosynnema sp. ALI-1.44]|uniref:hypothetical protein n=1 Tax=Actinosynnema sp. ALI-1.44 TaxID=1933779 RepID=UPI00097C8432|nr:hypothetical protein [Actinosynnema sp. ALI-1.44]ONI76326.1 hypothetical protein ALI144C_37355 [Actinosynnema sp. ALI-1.44]